MTETGECRDWESLEEWKKITKMLIINSNTLTLYHNKRSFRVYIFQDQIDSDNQVFLKSLNSLTNWAHYKYLKIMQRSQKSKKTNPEREARESE